MKQSTAGIIIPLVLIVGSLTVVAIILYSLPILADTEPISATDSTNLISTQTSISSAYPLLGVIIVIAVFGVTLERVMK
jgi:hypothetical protein